MQEWKKGKKNKENVEYRMMNNEYRSKNIVALKGRKITARGNALGLNVIIGSLAPRSETVLSD